MGMHYITWLSRFWNYVDKRGPDECWIWQGNTHKSDSGKRYGHMWDKRHQRQRVAHVIAYELETGKEIKAPLIGMHTCDVPLCCNPRHIKPGTTKENVQDSIQKGRFFKGRKWYRERITWLD